MISPYCKPFSIYIKWVSTSNCGSNIVSHDYWFTISHEVALATNQPIHAWTTPAVLRLFKFRFGQIWRSIFVYPSKLTNGVSPICLNCMGVLAICHPNTVVMAIWLVVPLIVWVSQAVPRFSQTSCFSQDGFAIAVIGTCPGSTHTACSRIQVPCFDAKGTPLILRACLHNLGRKQIKTSHEKEFQTAVSKTMILGFTDYRDECENQWSVLIKNPVNFALHALGMSDESPFVAPPWGRFFHNKKTSPGEAQSFQFARVMADKGNAFMKLSGKASTLHQRQRTKNSIQTTKWSGWRWHSASTGGGVNRNLFGIGSHPMSWWPRE